MEFLKLLLYAGLILTAAVTVCVTENSENHSNGIVNYSSCIQPIHYDISLKPNIEEHNFSFHGESNATIRLNCTIHSIRVHPFFKEIDKSATTLIDNNDWSVYKPTNYTYDKKTSTTLLTFDNELSRGSYILHIKFVGSSPINQRDEFFLTSYTSVEGGRVWLGKMPFVPVAVIEQDIMPCWGKPALVHTFNISVRHHYTFKAFSNMPIKTQHLEEDGMRWTYFDVTPLMSTCEVVVALADFVRVRIDTDAADLGKILWEQASESAPMPVRKRSANETVQMWCRSHLTSQMKYAQSIAEKAAKYLVQYTNISDGILKVDHITIPDFSITGLAYWGLILYTESDVTYDNRTDPLFRQNHVAVIITHETAHQWFGGLVSPSSLSHKWLSEGLASFFQMYILNKIFANWRVTDFLVVDQLHISLSEDTGLIMDSIKLESNYFFQIKTFFFSHFYDKAPVVLRMLQHVITDEVFRNGIITYLSTYKYNSATSDDFWAAMQAALNKSNIPHEDFKVKEVMDTWITQKHYPLVTVTRNYETGETIISQEHFYLQQAGNDTNNKWWVPVTLATQTNPDFSNTLPNYWLTPLNQNISLQINPSDWIIINLQQVGYYRVNYDSMNWQKISNYLNSEEYTKIHVLNRAQIIDDAYAMMMNKRLEFSIFLNLTGYLSRETDYIAWYPMFLNLAKMLEFFSLPESEVFKSHIAKTVDGLLKTIGYDEVPEEDDIAKQRRVEAAKLACLVGNSECKRMATAKLNYHLAHADTHKLSSWWQQWTYCSGLMAANRTTWERTMDLFVQERNKNLLEFLACSEDFDIIINYLNIIVSNNLTLQDNECIRAFNSIVIKHARNNVVLSYILENFETVKPNSMNTVTVLKHIISNVYSKEQLDKIKEFMTRNPREEPEVSTAIQSAIENRLVDLENLVDKFGFLRKEN